MQILKMSYNKALLTLLMIILCSTAFCQESKEIRKIDFSGNSSLSNSILKELITLQKSTRKDPSYYSTDIYEEDKDRIKSLYQREGYLYVEILAPSFTTFKKDKINITFNIKENTPVRINEVKFTVNQDKKLQHYFKPGQIRKISKQLNTRKGRIFKDQDIYDDDVNISKQFEDKGFPYVKINPVIKVDSENKLADINWEINTGNLCYFGDVNFVGSTELKEKKLRKQVAFEKGDVFSRDEIERTQDNFYNLGIYRIASTKSIFTNDQPDTIQTMVTLKEAPRLSSKWGLGYGRETKLRVFGQITFLRFLGGSRRAELYGKHSAIEPYDFNLRLIQPALYSPNSQLILSPYVSKQNEPGYTLQKTGGSITILQKISKNLNMSLGYQHEQVNLDTTSIADLPENETLESFYNKAGFNYGFTFSNALPQFDPTEGIFLAANVKTNGMYSNTDYAFYKFIAEVRRYKLIKHGWIIATKLKTGTIITPSSTKTVPVEERFFSGGSQSVRGYNRQEIGPKDENGQPIGGNTIFEASIENRISLFRKTGIGMVIFSDIGNVWQDDLYLDFRDLYYTIGAGLRYKTPIGPIGIDVARPVFRNTNNGWLFYINIGHSF
ncbi:hypothetical protein E9993_11190 [Labilibacter sediminis]|nr:hypothetical protein E9993_11190 [Labilibacter sediminis]